MHAYGDRYDILRMYYSKRSVSHLIGEEVEERSLMGRLGAEQKEQKHTQKNQTQRTGEIITNYTEDTEIRKSGLFTGILMSLVKTGFCNLSICSVIRKIKILYIAYF